MNHLLRPRIWASFLASSGVGPCDVPFRYASDQSRGTAGRLPGGTPTFVVSRQQFIKYPGYPIYRKFLLKMLDKVVEVPIVFKN